MAVRTALSSRTPRSTRLPYMSCRSSALRGRAPSRICVPGPRRLQGGCCLHASPRLQRRGPSRQSRGFKQAVYSFGSTRPTRRIFLQSAPTHHMPVCRATAITADGSCLLCRYLGTGQDVTGATVHKYAFLKTETTPETFGEAPRAPHDERPKEITWREVKPIAATNFSGSGYNTYYRPSAAPEAAEHVKETWASRQCMQGPLAGATRFEPEIGPLFSSHQPTLLLTGAHSSPHRSPLFSSQEPSLLLTGARIRLASGYAALAAASASA